MKPRMSSAAQSTLPLQAMMSFGPTLTTMTGGSKPAARWPVSQTDMFAPGLPGTILPAWNPTPAAIRTGPQPRSASIRASDGPHPGTRGASYAEPSMTESPTTAIPPRGPAASMNTDTNNGGSADADGAAIVTAVQTIAMTIEMARVRMRHSNLRRWPRPRPPSSSTPTARAQETLVPAAGHGPPPQMVHSE